MRPEGSYRVTTERPDGATWAFYGRYLEIAAPARLVYTLRWTAPMAYGDPEETITVDLSPSGEGTVMEFRHDGVPSAVARREHEKGWNDTFDALAALVGA